MRIPRSWLAVSAFALVAAGPGAGLAAGGLSVSPVSLEFDAAGAARALEVSNPGDAPTDVQVRLFAWRADQGEDQLTPSRDIAFSPPMFHLAPGARQVVRLAAGAPPRDGERAYRLFVDQLPGPPTPGVLRMPVRMVLPLFVEPPSAGRPVGPKALVWRAVFDPATHRLSVTAVNSGPRRIRLLDLGYERDGRTVVFAPGLAGYVLAGAQRTWAFDYAGPLPSTLRLRAATDLGDLVAEAPLPTG